MYLFFTTWASSPVHIRFIKMFEKPAMGSHKTKMFMLGVNWGGDRMANGAAHF